MLNATNEQSQEELDANAQRNQQRLKQLFDAIPKGYRPNQAELGLIDQYGYKIENGQVKKKSWWEINKSAVLGAAGVAGAGVLSGLGLFGGTASGAAGASSGAASTAAGASTLLGEGGIPAGLSTAGVTPGLIGEAVGGGGGGVTGFLKSLGGKAITGIADTLSGAADSAQQSNDRKAAIAASLENTRLGRDQFALNAPGERMNSSVRAALAKNYTPSVAHWGGPGSGLRGEVPTYSGSQSFHDAIHNADTQGLMDRVLKDETAQQQHGGITGDNADAAIPTNIGQDSTGDKILGGTSLGSSLLAAILRGRK